MVRAEEWFLRVRECGLLFLFRRRRRRRRRRRQKQQPSTTTRPWFLPLAVIFVCDTNSCRSFSLFLALINANDKSTRTRRRVCVMKVFEKSEVVTCHHCGDDNLQAAAAPDHCAFSMREQVRENCASKFLGAGTAAAAPRQCPMTKANAPAAGGVKKKKVDGDYRKRRKPAPSEATLAKRSAAKEKALAARDKAAAVRALAKTAAATKIAKAKPKPKPKTKPMPVKNHHGRPSPPSCRRGWKMVWMSKDYIRQRGGRIVHKKMMRHEQGRQNGHWLMVKE
jgi:hypothetical protein